MRTQKFVQVLALLLLASGCSILGTCKTDADCHSLHPDSHCYVGENPKPGDTGVCTRKKPVSPGESVDEPGSGSVDELGGEPGDKVAAGLVISSFSPHEAPQGAILRIQGENFSAVPSENIVTFNGIPAAVVSAIENEIVVKVPKSMLCAGPVRVTTGGKTAVSADTFTYFPTAVVSTVAGSGTAGFAEGTGTAAQFNQPYGVAIDRSNNLYVADTNNHRIRAISPQGVVSTFAGTGTQGSVDSGRADSEFNQPYDILIGTDGTLYVADTWNHRIRTISLLGAVRTLAGSGRDFIDGTGTAAGFRHPYGMAIDTQRNLYVADSQNHRIRKVTPQGVVSTIAGNSGGFLDGTGTDARFYAPNGVAIDTEGNLYVADYNNHRIRKISPEGVVSTFAGSGERGVADGQGSQAQFNWPNSIAMDAADNLYVVDNGSHRIRRVTPQGLVSTIAGGGIEGDYANGPGKLARFNRPRGIAIDTDGNLYVADTYNHRIRKIALE